MSGYVDKWLELRADADLTSSVAEPMHELLTRLQDERRFTAVWLADSSGSSRTAMDNARGATDDALEGFYRNEAALQSDDGTVKERVQRLRQALDKLAEQRDAVDKRSAEPLATYRYFTEAVLRCTAVVTSATEHHDGDLARRADAMASLLRLSERIAQDDTRLSAVLTKGGTTEAVRDHFADSEALRRQVRDSLDPERLPADEAASWRRLTDSTQWKSLVSIGEAVSNGSDEVAQRAEEWRKAADEVSKRLRELTSDSLDGLAGDASDQADGHLLEAAVAALLALAALATAAVLALRQWRSVSGRLDRLHQATMELAEKRIPQTMEKLASGEAVEPTARPRGGANADELARLDAAIHHLAHVAETTAVQQARGFEGTEKVFANLTRRTQGLIHRLISLLDDLERKHEDSDLLKDIFKVDHLATRVRRHSENLVILGGSLPTRRWSAPVSIIDVLRSAVSETEEYTRVKVQTPPPSARVSVVGRTVADLTHLLAELIENGTSFSPPDTQVTVSAKKVAKGLALHVEDHGLGMPEGEYERINAVLAEPPEPDMMTLGQDPRLGLFVVARLAQRHNLKVSLRESHYGGTLAIVLVPAALLEETESPLSRLPDLPIGKEEEESEETPDPAAAPARDVQPRHDAAAMEPPSGEGLLPPGAPTHAPDSTPPSAPDPEPATAPQSEPATAPEPASPPRVLFPGVGAKTLPYHPLDESGYPTYGGAGLLPPVQENAADAGQPPSGPATPPPAPAQGATTSTPAASPTSAPRAEERGGTGSRETSGAENADPFSELKTPRVLPKRVRGQSLVRQLRDTPAPSQHDSRDDHSSSPDRSAATMAAIQRGTGRARGTGAPRPAGGHDPQAETPGHGTDQL